VCDSLTYRWHVEFVTGVQKRSLIFYVMMCVWLFALLKFRWLIELVPFGWHVEFVRGVQMRTLNTPAQEWGLDPAKLQRTATHYNTLQHIAVHCNTLQHTAKHCNTHDHSGHSVEWTYWVGAVYLTRWVRDRCANAEFKNASQWVGSRPCQTAQRRLVL